MIRIAVIGDIGSGKSHIAKLFGFPVFNADKEVAKLYKESKKCFFKLKKKLPKYIKSFPVSKSQIINAINDKESNIKKIIKIIHPEVQVKMNTFLKKNKNKKFLVLDVPLLIENKINKKSDILVFVDSQKNKINKRLKKRPNFNLKIVNKFKKFQLSLVKKKKKSDFIIKNNFKNNSVKKDVKKIIKKILLNDRSYT
jgi:dephospho-CoA kinase